MKSTLVFCVAVMAACTTAAPADDPVDPPAVSPGPADPGHSGRAGARAVHYTADLRVMESFPVQLAASMNVHNPTTRTVTLHLPGGCPLLLRAYRDAARTQLAWDQAAVLVCTMQLQIVNLEPNRQQEFTGRTDARGVLGDSLPDGTYHMTARLVVNDTVIERPVGAVQLAVPR